MSKSEAILTTETLRIVACAVCGISHAIPLAAYLAAVRDRLPIYCPRGHTWMPRAADADPDLNLPGMVIELRAALADAGARLAAAQAELAEAGINGNPPGKRELRRRANYLANVAEVSKAGDVVCPCCGRAKRQYCLAVHLRRQHADELAAMPPGKFK